MNKKPGTSKDAADKLVKSIRRKTRQTQMKFGDEVCTSMEELKAYSMNLGHENLATSIDLYLPVSEQRQLENIQGMAEESLECT